MPALILAVALTAVAHDHDGRPCRWRPDQPLGTPVTLRWSLAPDFALPGIDRPTARRLIRRAWRDWSRVAGVRARETKTAARSYVHFRSTIIDGPGFCAARAFFPCDAIRSGTDSGHVLFDSADPCDEAEFRKIARHEVGHCLGLSHGPVGSWMTAVVDDYPEHNRPTWWDVAEIRARYGAGRHAEPPPPFGLSMVLGRGGPGLPAGRRGVQPEPGPLRLRTSVVVDPLGAQAELVSGGGLLARRPGGLHPLLQGAGAMSDDPGDPLRCARCGVAGLGVRVGPASGSDGLCPWCWLVSPVVDDGADEDDGPDGDEFDDGDFDTDED